MKLIEPTMEYAAEIEAYRAEFLLAGDSMDGCGRLRRFEKAADWINDGKLFRDPATVPEGWMPATQYICVREADRKIVGMLDIRHRFNDYLEKYGGHIGYSVRPGERRKGYAEWMLSRALPECVRLGIGRVLVCCIKGNEGSRRTILKNGGVYECTVREPGKGKEIERYWIDLKDRVFSPRKHIAEIMFRPVSPATPKTHVSG